MGPLDQTPIPIHWISSLFHLQGEIYPWLVNLLCLSHQSMNSTHILDQILAVCSLCESCLGRQDMPYLPPAFTAQTEVLLCLINQYTTMTDQRMTKADWDSIHGKTAPTHMSWLMPSGLSCSELHSPLYCVIFILLNLHFISSKGVEERTCSCLADYNHIKLSSLYGEWRGRAMALLKKCGYKKTYKLQFLL